MEEQLISFETAKLAKEKGFNNLDNIQVRTAYVDVRNNRTLHFDYFITDPNGVVKSETCGTNSSDFEGLRRTYITKDVSKENEYRWYLRPTQSLLQKWLREVHKLFVEIYIINDIANEKQVFHFLVINPRGMIIDHVEYNDLTYDTYEQALEVGLLEALKLTRNDKKDI